MENKRITIFSGHYGSGKTNIAVNYALDIANSGRKVAVADLDIVNPYFRTKDSEQLLNDSGIKLICSEYANTNVDIPALPQEMYCITDDTSTDFVLDVGGDERGALALGRLVPSIKAEDNYRMIFVVNFFRPLTADAHSAIEVMREIEAACNLKFSAIINNSNLGAATTVDDVASTAEKAKQLSDITALPLLYTTVGQGIYDDFSRVCDNSYKLTLQKRF